ncbi:hypothetical protein J6590_092345 [Homalodisca vitripennis]|nr:hypothetical protein J6590_092345 [Homalodisca vitripennis]
MWFPVREDGFIIAEWFLVWVVGERIARWFPVRENGDRIAGWFLVREGGDGIGGWVLESGVQGENIWVGSSVGLEEENFSFDRYTFSSWLQDSTDYFSPSPGSERRPIS